MFPLPSLAAALVAREAIHLATAQFLADWQLRAEATACPAASASLAKIVDLLPTLPRRPELASVAVDRLIAALITDIRQHVIADLRHPLCRARLQVYAERFAALVLVQA
ncbi:hypothetical protein [Geminicoccus roseus]|uniref:hypothetical protein n=1 Tax=Geminicoccus roseus TaxID=404900 RepID=UPI0004253F0C|nr:hypothetical protein [Geminicoccus roseus]